MSRDKMPEDLAKLGLVTIFRVLAEDTIRYCTDLGLGADFQASALHGYMEALITLGIPYDLVHEAVELNLNGIEDKLGYIP
jgi:hypothetical protein